MIGTFAILSGFKAASGSWIMHAALFCGLLFGTSQPDFDIDKAPATVLEINVYLRWYFLIAHTLLIFSNLIMNYGDTSTYTAIKWSFFYISLCFYLYVLGKAS